MLPSGEIAEMWTLTDGVTADRPYLMDMTIAPETIADEIAGNLAFAQPGDKAQFEVGKDNRVKDARRLSVRIAIPVKTYDLFLNHVNGYRGHYAHSKERGDEFNQTLLEKLAPKLVEQYGDSQVENALPRCELRLALKHPDAKIWEAEKPYEAAEYDWAIKAELGFKRWQDAANEAAPLLEKYAKELGCQSIGELAKTEKYSREELEWHLEKKVGKERKTLYKAIIAVRAPLPAVPVGCTCLQVTVKSAWLRNGQVVDAPKRDRARQLFEYGWT